MASRARNRRRFKSSTSRLTMQSYAIKPTATPILSAALWLRRPLGGRKASRTLPSSLPRRAPPGRHQPKLCKASAEDVLSCFSRNRTGLESGRRGSPAQCPLRRAKSASAIDSRRRAYRALDVWSVCTCDR